MSSVSELRQSAAELLGASLIDLFPGTLLVECGETDQGFFCSYFSQQPLDQMALTLLEERMRKLVKQDLPFRPIEMMRENAATYLEHHGQRIAAQQILSMPETIVSLIQMGNYCNLCSRSLLAKTSEVAAFKLLDFEEAPYEIENEGLISVKTVWGVAALDKASLKKFLKIIQASKTSDYRDLAKEQGIFTMCRDLSDAALVWLPAGTVLKQVLMHKLNEEYSKQNYRFVSTPSLIKQGLSESSVKQPSLSLYGTSYVFPEKLSVSHATLYKKEILASSHLPIRFVEWKEVFRSVKGLRYKSLLDIDFVTADFAHTFCAEGDGVRELISSLQFIHKFIKMFDFECNWEFIGQQIKISKKTAAWGRALDAFQEAFSQCGEAYVERKDLYSSSGPYAQAVLIDGFGREWKGPKIGIDLILSDSMQLGYQDREGNRRKPITITQSLLGSVERFVALLLEHYSGRLPLWLAPEQVRVIPVRESNEQEAMRVVESMASKGFRIGIDRSREVLGKKVFLAQKERIPYLAVVGDLEEKEKKITLRCREEGSKPKKLTLEELIVHLQREYAS